MWGAVASANEAARASLLAANYNKDAIKLTIDSNTTIAYFNILALDEELSITKELVALQEEIYEFNKKLFHSGVGDLITLNKAKLELSTMQSELPPEQSLIEQEKALKILLGRTAQEIVNGELQRAKLTNGLPLVITVPKILPSKFLERRPDIRAAEQNLIAGNAELEVVKAAYFPVISLTGLFGVNSTKLNKLFNNSSVNSSFGANATGSIIDFGQAKANVKIVEATKKQLLIQYQQTLRVAFQEVVNYLSAEQNSADNFKFFQKNEQALEEVMNSTLHRYNHGMGTYLDVLNAKQLLLRTKINKTKAKLQQLTTSVNLFHALGGDWQN